MTLSYPQIKTQLPGSKAKEIIAKDQAVMSPSYTRFYPLVIERGRGCQVEDVDGNKFLDMTGGIAVLSTGHSHPQVVKKIRERMFLLMEENDTFRRTLWQHMVTQ